MLCLYITVVETELNGVLICFNGNYIILITSRVIAVEKVSWYSVICYYSSIG